MGTISAASANYGLQAAGTPTGTNVAGTVRVGVGNTSLSLAGSDVAYSFTVTATGATDAFEYDTNTGAVTATVGSPTITDAGTDFEGAALAAHGPDAVLATTPSDNTGSITFATNGYWMPSGMGQGQTHLCILGPGTLVPPELTVTFTAIGDSITFVIIATAT